MIVIYTIVGFFLLYGIIGLVAIRIINRSAGIKKMNKKEKKRIDKLLDEILK